MDETPKKTKFSVSFVQKTPKKKKKEISKIRHLMSKVKEGVVVRQQVKAYDMKIVKKMFPTSAVASVTKFSMNLLK